MSDKCYNITVRSCLLEDNNLKYIFRSFRNQVYGADEEYSIDYITMSKNRNEYSYVSMDLHGDIKPGICILGIAGGRDRSIYICPWRGRDIPYKR